MSIKYQNIVWELAPYQGNTLLTLLALADWSDDKGISWPAVETLARKSRQSERNCRKTLRKLEDDGVITVQERDGTSSRYMIRQEAIQGGKDCIPAKSNRGGQRTTNRGANSDTNPASVCPLSVNEPSENHQEEPKPFSLNPADSTAGMTDVPVSIADEASVVVALDPEKLFGKNTKDPWAIGAMTRLWNLYLELTGRNPRTYQLTPKRAKMGVERLREAYAVSSIPGRSKQDICEMAYAQFEKAIRNLAEDEFLNGGNDRGRRYVEWDKHLCKDWETFEKRRRNGQ